MGGKVFSITPNSNCIIHNIHKLHHNCKIKQINRWGIIMNDKFSKTILVGILICLIIIVLKPNNIQISSPNPSTNVSVAVGEEIIQLAPNRIAVVDNNLNSGMRGTILIFDYDSNTKSFKYMNSMNYADYFRNPNKYGLPVN